MLARPHSPVVFVPIPPHAPLQPGRSMLNYIWAGLIIFSFVFALGYDVRDIANDRYRNGQPLPVELAFPQGYEPAARRVPVEIRIEPRGYASFYRTEQVPAASYPGYL